jgi:predicted esterase
MRNYAMAFGYMFLAVSCEAIDLKPGQSEPVNCASPEPCPTVTHTVTASPEPAPTVTVTASPEPQPTVTHTVTASPAPAPTVTVTASPSPKACPVCPSPAPTAEVAKLTAKPLGSVAGSPFGYMEYLPANYSKAAAASLPIIIHLHGIGERIGGQSGTAIVPLEKVANFGPYASYAKARPDFPAVILMPQGKKLSLWGAADVDAFITLALKNYKVNPKKVYLFGLSLGGFGVNSCMQLASCSQKVAAAVSICPGDMLQWTGSSNVINGKIPYRMIHAEDDTVVTIQTKMDPSIKNVLGVLSWPVVLNRPDLPTAATGYNSSTGCMDPLQKKFVWNSGQNLNHSAQVCFISYSQGGHGIWGRAYSDPQLYTWAFSKVKP